MTGNRGGATKKRRERGEWIRMRVRVLKDLESMVRPIGGE